MRDVITSPLDGAVPASPRVRGRPRRWPAFAPLFTLPVGAAVLTWHAEPCVLMVAVVASILFGCKWLTWWDAPPHGSALRNLGYLLAWPGMDAPAFLDPRPFSQRPAWPEWAAAAALVACGAALLWGASRVEPPVARAWVGVTGLLLLFHLGGFSLLSLGWRRYGVRAASIMNRPAAATSLSDFWGRRWNTAFRDLAHRYVFRPLICRLGPARGAILAFAASGLVHELAISLPARGGFGLPTAYFLFQGLAISAERSRAGRRLGLGRGAWGRLFAALCVVGPAYELFHPPFMERVVLPLLGLAGTGDA